MANMAEQEELAKRAESLLGTIFADRYLVQSVLGKGGMGVVYKAEHLHMKRAVALKMLLPGVVVSDYKLRRFQQESRAASNLTHPNIVSTYDFGISNGQAFLVMDFIEGQPLSDEVQKVGVMSQERCLRIFTQVAEALAHAHKKGVIHRDIKDSNIMLVSCDGEDDVAKLVDFGLAKVMKSDDESMSLTETGAIIGSPLYMSPEHCRGTDCDVRSDIYSLGCVMYRCLCGQPPFMGRSAIDTIQMHLANLPASMKTLNPSISISREMELLVNRCMFKEPAHRYQSVQDLLHDMRLVPPPGSSTEPVPQVKSVVINPTPSTGSGAPAAAVVASTSPSTPATSGSGSGAAQIQAQSQSQSRGNTRKKAAVAKARSQQTSLLIAAASVLLIATIGGSIFFMTRGNDVHTSTNQFQSMAAAPDNSGGSVQDGSASVQLSAAAAPATAARQQAQSSAPGNVRPNNSTMVLGPATTLTAAQTAAASADPRATAVHTSSVSAPPAVAGAPTATLPFRRPGRLTASRQPLMERLARMEQSGSDSPLLLPVLIELAVMDLQDGAIDTARPWYQRALRIYQANSATLGANDSVRDSLCNMSWKFNDLDQVSNICTGHMTTESSGPNWLTSSTPTPARTTDPPARTYDPNPTQPQHPEGNPGGPGWGPPGAPGSPGGPPPIPAGMPAPPYPGWHPGMPMTPQGNMGGGPNGNGGWQ